MGGDTYTGSITVTLTSATELKYVGSFYVEQFSTNIVREFTADYQILSLENSVQNVLMVSKDYNDTTMDGSNEQAADVWAKFAHELNWQLNPADNTMTRLTDYTGEAKMAMGGTDFKGDLDIITVDETECIYMASFYVAQFSSTMTRLFTADYTIDGDTLTVDDDYNATTMQSGNEQPADIWAKFADQKVFTIGEGNTLTLKVSE